MGESLLSLCQGPVLEKAAQGCLVEEIECPEESHQSHFHKFQWPLMHYQRAWYFSGEEIQSRDNLQSKLP